MSKKVQTKTSKFFIMLSIVFLLAAALTVPAIDTFAEICNCDVNGDGVAGLAEAIYILQRVVDPDPDPNPPDSPILKPNRDLDVDFISIASGLYIQTKEVTWNQWDKIKPGNIISTKADKFDVDDVENFIKKLNEETYRLPYKDEYDRLPDEYKNVEGLWYKENDSVYKPDGKLPDGMSTCCFGFRVVWCPEGCTTNTTTTSSTTTSTTTTTTGSDNSTSTTTTTTGPDNTTTTNSTTTITDTDTHSNSFGMTFKLIPERTFYMQTTEVTQGQWKALMDGNPSYFSDCGDDCPVEKVWTPNIADFIVRLNADEQKNGEYRLPTADEWEYAARAGSTTDFASGYTKCENNPDIDAMAWYCDNSDWKTHPVAQKNPNEWGLYDMYGNVREVCQSGSYQVMIGGGWGSNISLAEKPEFESVSSATGFRLVWIPEETIKPVAPLNVQLNAGDGNVIISWDKVVGAESYNIYYKADDPPGVINGLYDKKIGGIAETSRSVEDLVNDTTYYFVVTAVNSVGESDASNAVSATPEAGIVTIPDAPTNIWAVPPEGGKVKLSWDSVEGSAFYNIYFATQPGVKKSNYASLQGGIKESNVTNPHTIESLTNKKTYYFVVTAQNAAGESAESNEVSAMPMDMTTFTNSRDMTFVRIPPGTFMMGSPEDELGRDSDETLHQVTLTKPFFMQTTEVTQENWIDVTGENNPAWFWSFSTSYPVESVKMDDIERFIVKMNTLGQDIYRLPTEAEWEYAARAGSSTAFASGEITAKECAYDAILNAMGWYCENSPFIIGRKESNLWGLYDMHGNIWEACQDGYYGDYLTDAVQDTLPPASTVGYVIRGGSFYDGVEKCRSASRERFRVDTYSSNIGFRLVREDLE